MIRPLFVARGALLCALVAGAACHRRVAPKIVAPAADSLRGTVSVTGAALEQRLVLRLADPAVHLSVSPADSAALERVSGAEIVVRGQADPAGFRVVDFTVVRVDAVPALDGVLRGDGSHLVLETRAGRVVLGNPPSALRNMIGARVWLTGPPSTGPLVYGVITP